MKKCDRRRAASPPAMAHDDYTWMNAAYVMGTRLTDAFAKYGLLHGDPRRRGRRQGRGPAGPRLHQRRRRPRPQVPDRDRHHRPPRGRAAKLGFLPLATTRIPIMPCSSARRPCRSRRSTTGPRPRPTPPSRRGCRTSWRRRFAHYLKVMARDKIGSFMEASDCEALAEPLDQELRQRQRARRPGDRRPGSRCARPRSRSSEIPGKPARTTPSPGCVRGCSSRN